MGRLSIRGILLLTVGALTLIIALLVAQEMHRNWERLTVLRGLKDAIFLSDQIFNVTDAVSIERDIAISMLETPDRDFANGLAERLGAARSSMDATQRATTAALRGYDFAGLPALRAKWATRLGALRSLRTAIDRDLKLPLAQRDAALPGRWSAEVAAFMSETQGLWNVFIKPFAGVDPYTTQHLRFKYLLRTIIDRAGRERSVIGGLITANAPPTPEQVSELLRDQGTSDLAWSMGRMLAEHSGLYPSIAAEYTDATSHYATLHEMIQGIFYVPGAGGAVAYPIGIDLWLEMSTQVTDSLLALRDSATQHTQAHAIAMIEDAQREIAIKAVIFALALFLCGYSFWVIVARVVRPVKAIVGALLAASRGERVAFAGAEGRRDEIGQLGEVLTAFNARVEEIKRTSRELGRSQSALRAVVDHAVDGLITLDAAGIVKSYNPACERIFGYAESEVAGRHFKMLLPDPSQSPEDLVGDALGITGSAGREYNARRKGGAVFPVELSISAFTLDGAQHFSGIVRDITQRKAAEEELADYTRALERSNKELDDFAYIASHDLKEPLRGIHNHSRFLLEDNAEKLEKESVDRLDRLVYLSQRMERLVNDLLYFSRLGRQELAIQPADINEVIHDVESTLDVFLSERKAKILVPNKLPSVVCDKTKVTELFRNLITNAIKYNDKPEKSVEIGWFAQHKSADGEAMRNVFYVRDDGRGIAREFHTEIFRIFKRLQGGKEKEEGTGVGLTFVKKIVERHGGRIWLESEPGHGTTFYFTLEATHHERDHGSQAA
jgi:PAS domain S-box-containing protein